jgi:hypothetical protein
MSLPDPAALTTDPSGNTTHADSTYSGNVYALGATGGFTMERGFDDIKLAPSSVPVNVDVTNSIQVLMDVATFNAKLGLIKNAANTAVETSSFDEVNDYFKVGGVEKSTISLSAAELITGISKSAQVIAVGKYSTLYSSFQSYVATYFGFDGGFSSLFTAASEFAIDGSNNFTGASFKRLLNGETKAVAGNYISDLSGSITISNITELLRYAVNANIFGNRTPYADLAQNASGTAVDPVDKNNYGVEDGFIAGDLIWVPAGTTVTLVLKIDSESFNPLNNQGVSNAVSTAQSQSTSFTSTNFTMNTQATTELIKRTCTAPLLIKLVNKSTLDALASDAL